VNEASNVKHASASASDFIPLLSRKTRATAQGGDRKGHSYKQLPTQLRRDGFDLRQIAREGNLAIYTQVWNGCPDPSVCFEVIRVKRREGFEINGRFVDAAEVYPPSELWGVDGFTFTDRNKAWAKFFEISLEEPARTGREVK
jgi:hypothetical protein